MIAGRGAAPRTGATKYKQLPARKLFGLIVAATLVGVGQAQATVLGFTGSLTTTIGPIQTLGAPIPVLPPITATGSGTATVSGTSITSLSLVGGSFPLTFLSIPVTDPAATPIIGIQVKNINNSAGSFSGGPPIAGKMALRGSAIICILGSGVGCSAPSTNPPTNLNVPFTVNGTRGVGLGGAPIFVPPRSGIKITVNGNPWTAGTAAVNTGMGTLTVMGFLHGPASGGAATAGQASGVVQLVTPMLISTSIGSIPTVPAFDVLNIHFTAVPEPSTLLLLSSSLVLLMLGRSRRSSPEFAGNLRRGLGL